MDEMLGKTGDELNFVASLKVPDQVIIERIEGAHCLPSLVEGDVDDRRLSVDRFIHLPSGRTYNVRVT